MKSSLTFAILLLVTSSLHAHHNPTVAVAPVVAGPLPEKRLIAAGPTAAAPMAAGVDLGRVKEPAKAQVAAASESEESERSMAADPSAVALLGLGLLILAALRRRAQRE